MTWLSWLLIVMLLMAIFIVCDWIFCGGRYCRWFFRQ